MRIVAAFIVILLAGCTAATEPNAQNSASSSSQQITQRRLPRTPADELLPHIRETEFEVRENYQQSVELLNAMRDIPELSQQYHTLETYVESLTRDLATLEKLIAKAEMSGLTEEDGTAYRQLRTDWRARSAVTVQAMQQQVEE